MMMTPKMLIQTVPTGILKLSHDQIRLLNASIWLLIGLFFGSILIWHIAQAPRMNEGFDLIAGLTTLFLLACYGITSVLIRHLWEIRTYQSVILDVQKSLLMLTDPRLMYDRVVHQITRKTDAIAAYIVTQDSETGFSVIESAAQEDPHVNSPNRTEYLSQLCPTIVAMKVFDSGKCYGPVNPKAHEQIDVSKDPRRLFRKVRSALAVPVFVNKKEEPYAVLVIEAVASVYFSSVIIDSIRTLCNSLGEAISRHMEARQLAEAKSHFENIAHIDALTKIGNRRSLDIELPLALERSRISGQLLAVIVLDLDDFKPVNDTYGHQCGDEVLRFISQRFLEGLRCHDSAYRLGGDEFVVLIEGLQDEHQLPDIMQRIADLVRQPIVLSCGDRVSIGMSAGVHVYSGESTETAEAIIAKADRALYSIKSRKHDRECFWTTFAA